MAHFSWREIVVGEPDDDGEPSDDEGSLDEG